MTRYDNGKVRRQDRLLDETTPAELLRTGESGGATHVCAKASLILSDSKRTTMLAPNSTTVEISHPQNA